MRMVILCLFLALMPLVARSQSAGAALQPGREHIAGTEVLLGTVQTKEGYPLRAFITRPQGAKGKLPVIFMVGWLSCDTAEAPKDGPDDGFKQLLFDLASRSGYATYRMDKPGVGESKGPACGDADFNTELSAYRAAFAAMSAVDFIDTSRIYVLGFSNGGGFAPLVPGPAPVRGYMVFGGWYKTWLEHMMEHERRRMKLSGLPETVINSRMRNYATFYDLYLNQRLLPGEIIHVHPEMKELWQDKPDGQYGRPAAFYQQLQQLNLAETWQSVDAPVLAIHGEYDWIMSGDDYRFLADAVNARHPGSATYLEWPRADHLLLTHATREKAFAKDPDEKYDPTLSQSVLEWLTAH
jgi:pimeloyl-ACP methyl ester carboxylesterase